MEEILRYISTQGLALFLIALIVYFGIQFLNIYLEKFKKRHEVKQHDRLTDLRQQLGKEIKLILDNMLLRTHGIRAYVFEFHNGVMSMGGLPFGKMSCTYEVLEKNTSSEMYDRQNLSLFLYSTLIDSLHENRYIVADTMNRTDIESSLGYETLVKRGIITTIRAGLRDKNNRVFGFVGVDYDVSQSDENIDTAISIIGDTSVKVGTLLSIED
jgi:hypothetical protein